MQGEDINWAKLALRFIATQGIATRFEDWSAIAKRSMTDLRQAALASEVIFVKREDSLTARIVNPEVRGTDKVYIDPALLDRFGNEPEFFSAPFDQLDQELTSQFKNLEALVALPLQQTRLNGVLILVWDHPFHFTQDFREFIASCYDKIKESAQLSNTY